MTADEVTWHINGMTPRTQQVFAYILDGWEYDDIAKKLGIQYEGVAHYTKSIMDEFQIRNMRVIVAKVLGARRECTCLQG